MTGVGVGDIVSVNGQAVKGTALQYFQGGSLSSTFAPGTKIADITSAPSGASWDLTFLNPDGTLILIAEIYKGASTTAARLVEKYAEQSGMALLSVDEHRALFINAGYSDVQIIEKRDKGWICGIGRKPIANS